MKLRLAHDELTDAVTWAARALTARAVSSWSAGTGLMLEARQGALQLSAFDQEVASTASTSAEVGEEGRAFVPGRLLAEICRHLPGGDVELSADPAQLTLVCPPARFTLPILSEEEYFPPPPAPPLRGHVTAAAFAAGVNRVVPAAGREESRPHLTVIHVEFTGAAVTLVATDGARLAITTLPWRPLETGDESVADVRPRALADTARALSGSSADLAVNVGGDGGGSGLLSLATPDRSTTVRLQQVNFPAYRTLLSAPTPNEIEVSTVALTDAVKRMLLVPTRERARVVTLRVSEGELTCEASGDGAQASEAMEAGYTGEPVEMSFNAAFLLDGLAALQAETTVLSFAHPQRPVLITGREPEQAGPTGVFTYLLMPLRPPA